MGELTLTITALLPHVSARMIERALKPNASLLKLLMVATAHYPFVSIPTFLSTLSLLISVTTAWLNLRRGRVRMTQPRRVLLFPRAVYIDALLTSSGSRGKILEELVLVLEEPAGRVELREWIHQKVGDKGWSERTSVFVPFTGYAASHQWFFTKRNNWHTYAAGKYVIDIIDVNQINKLTRRGGIIFSLKFHLTQEEVDCAFVINNGEYDKERSGHIELDWNFFARRYEVMPMPESTSEEDEEKSQIG